MGLYLEDFHAGQSWQTRARRIDREMITRFAELTGDDNPLHTDRQRMRDTELGDVIAHGLLIESVVIGLIAELGIMDGTTIALAEVNARFRTPVLPGDEIHAEIRIGEIRPSRKPDRGVIVREVTVRNQRAETVIDTRLVNVMRRREAGARPSG